MIFEVVTTQNLRFVQITPFVHERTVYELRDDLSGWEERPDLLLPVAMGYFNAATYFY